MKVIKTAGYEVLAPLDTERYPPREGLEGPFRLKSGKVVYYDPKGTIPDTQARGAYWDPGTDMYLTTEEYEAHNAARPNPHQPPVSQPSRGPRSV